MIKQSKTQDVIIVKLTDGDVVYIKRAEFVDYYNKNTDNIEMCMYIKKERLRKFTKNGLLTFINKIK